MVGAKRFFLWMFPLCCGLVGVVLGWFGALLGVLVGFLLGQILYAAYAARQVKIVLGWRGEDPGILLSRRGVAGDEMILLGLGIGAVFWDGPPTVGQVQVLDGFLRHLVARNPSDIRQLKQICDEMIRLEGPRSEAVLQSLAVAHGRWLSRPVQYLGIRDVTARDQSPENVALWLYHLAGSESGGMTREKLTRLIALCRGLGVDGEQMLQRFRQVPHLSTPALEALGLMRGAGIKEVKRRYRVLQQQLHPDRRNGEPGDGYHRVQEAYELLSWQIDLPH